MVSMVTVVWELITVCDPGLNFFVQSEIVTFESLVLFRNTIEEHYFVIDALFMVLMMLLRFWNFPLPF